MIRCEDLQWGVAAHCPLTPPLDLNLAAGSLTAVVGANGSGKSSLLKVLAGLQRPLSGRVSIAVPRLRGLGYLAQQTPIDRQFPIDLGALVSGGFWGQRLRPAERRNRLAAALGEWRLDGLQARPLQALSGGELQRALLARLSLSTASVFLLDEPDAALDEDGQDLLWRHFRTWQQAGRTLLVASHDLGRVREEVEHCLVIDRRGCRCGQCRKLIASSGLSQVA